MWLIDESVRRHDNNMARVTELLYGGDGVIQSASTKTSDGILYRAQYSWRQFSMIVCEMKTGPTMLAPRT